jgi:hypothetical protein
VLESITHPQLRDQVAFAKTAARDLLDGRIHGSQALSANLLDTVLRTHFDDGTRFEIVGKGGKTRPRERSVIDGLPAAERRRARRHLAWPSVSSGPRTAIRSRATSAGTRVLTAFRAAGVRASTCSWPSCT